MAWIISPGDYLSLLLARLTRVLAFLYDHARLNPDGAIAHMQASEFRCLAAYGTGRRLTDLW